MATERDRRIAATMAACNCSYEEAAKILREDAAIDRGDRLDWEPTEEEEKAIRAANKIQGERKPRTKTERERPVDLTKREIIEKIRSVLAADYSNVVVTNVEKVIEFSIGDDNYAIDLKKHREKKS